MFYSLSWSFGHARKRVRRCVMMKDEAQDDASFPDEASHFFCELIEGLFADFV